MISQNDNKNNLENKVCIYIFNDDTKPFESINKEIKELGGFLDFANAGWFLSIENKLAAKKICETADLFYIELPIEDFEAEKQKINIKKLEAKASELESEIKTLTNLSDIDALLTNEIKQSDNKILFEKLNYYKNVLNKINKIKISQELSKLNLALEIKEPILNAKDLLPIHEQSLQKFRGKKYIGLCQKTIKDLDDKLLGLRKLILLAAPPNVGKTALTIQLAIDCVINNTDTCMLYVSLEMSRDDIFSRMRCYFAEMPWSELYFGNLAFPKEASFFDSNAQKNLDISDKKIEEIGERVLILDTNNCPNISADKILSYANDLKQKTKTEHIIIVIDYLQVWPIPDNIGLTLRTEIDLDKWRTGQMKLIRDGIQNDPIIVISEARKPSNSSKHWGNELSEVMGTARATYTPDVVFLLNPLDDDELFEGVQNILEDEFDEKAKSEIRKYFSLKNEAITKLRISKGRDGMQRGDILLKYYFEKNKFEQFDWEKEKENLIKKSFQKKELKKDSIKPARKISSDKTKQEKIEF